MTESMNRSLFMDSALLECKTKSSLRTAFIQGLIIQPL